MFALFPSECPRGGERFVAFKDPSQNGKTRVQYDYRDMDGVLFSIIADTLEEARRKRDDWLEHRGEVVENG